jgi:hypothetical protein
MASTTHEAEYAPRGLKRKHGKEPEALLRQFADHAPSSLAEATTFQKAIRTDLVHLNRPFEFHTVPIALLQKEFGEFRDDCEAAPSVQAQKLSLQLTVTACQWHDDELSRTTMVYDVFKEYAGLQLTQETIPGTRYRTDGNLMAHIIPPAIRKCKLEKGCALFEAIGYYANFLKDKLNVSGTRFPCVLMLDVGKSAFFFVPQNHFIPKSRILPCLLRLPLDGKSHICRALDPIIRLNDPLGRRGWSPSHRI